MMNLNLNLNLNLGRGNVDKASTKPGQSNPTTKRRALGDITNAVVDEDIRSAVNNKKPLFTIATQSHPTEQREIEKAASQTHIADDREYMLRVIDDIDGRDADNPLLVTCYVNELYDHFNELEKEFRVSSTYMGKQEFVNDKMRSILVDWLVRNSSAAA